MENEKGSLFFFFTDAFTNIEKISISPFKTKQIRTRKQDMMKYLEIVFNGRYPSNYEYLLLR